MKLITELVESVDHVIVESKRGVKDYFIEGIFMQAETPNRNGRLYPRTTMESQIQKYNELITAKRSLSELGHPSNPQVNLDKVSHLITKLYMEDDGRTVTGKAKILDTPMGKIAKNLLDEGVKLGVSSRGLGSLQEKNGVNVVQPDFHLSAIDIVSDPSGPDCWVNGIMEGSEWIYNASTNSWMLAEQIKKNINKMSSKEVATKQARLFEHFLNSIK